MKGIDRIKEKRAEYFAQKFSRLNLSRTSNRFWSAGSGESGSASRQDPGQEGERYLIRCPKCGRTVDRERVVRRKYICYECGGYFRVKIHNRIRMVADPHTFEPWFSDTPVRNPLVRCQVPDRPQMPPAHSKHYGVPCMAGALESAHPDAGG